MLGGGGWLSRGDSVWQDVVLSATNVRRVGGTVKTLARIGVIKEAVEQAERAAQSTWDGWGGKERPAAVDRTVWWATAPHQVIRERAKDLRSNCVRGRRVAQNEEIPRQARDDGLCQLR